MELTKQQKVLQQVVTEAWDNPTFKQELIASPIEAIRKLTGETIQLPEGKTFQVFDQSNPDVVSLTIPPKPSLEDVELTDSQLEAVAGGVAHIEGFPWDDVIVCFPPFDRPILIAG